MDNIACIYDIPDDHIQLIALELPLYALARFARTSKRINAIVNEDIFWKTKCSFKAQYQLFCRQIFAFCTVDAKVRVLQLIGDDKKEWRQRGADLDISLSSYYSPGVIRKRTNNTVWMYAQDLAFYELNVFTMQVRKLNLAVLPSAVRRCGSFVIHQNVLYLFGSTQSGYEIFSLDLSDSKAKWLLFANSKSSISTADALMVGDEIYWQDCGCYQVLHTKTRQFRHTTYNGLGQGDMRSCLHNNQLYRVGGMGFGVTAEFCCYDIATNDWISMPRMLSERMSAAVCVHRDRMWVVGGWDSMYSVPECESYDFEQQEWREEARLPLDFVILYAVAM
eukprot:TRINITY_DN3084_c0_g1_i1.p1 TRINITY_DN3084_c0_g1~~TRINITY_DN3084_c0_g1_i1.p1  ORF type:complete len:352 (+),score=39.81 TRINITY_DN3084_c0_g1_i1:52-1056(+)